MKKLVLMIISISLLVMGYTSTVFMNETEDKVVYDNFEVSNQLDEKWMEFSYIDAYGNVMENNLEKEESIVQKRLEEKENLPVGIGGTEMVEYGVVNFKTKPDSTYNTQYTVIETGESGYTNGYYGADGAFLGYSEDGTKVKFMQSGVIGWVNTSEVEVIDVEIKDVYLSFYKVSNGKLYHYGVNDVYTNYWNMVNMIGYKQDYMTSGAIYYSYDGHYFYTSYETMIDDYKEGIRSNSINPEEPYYNYYQYLSHRSKTNITADMLDTYVEYVLNDSANKNNSKMLNTGEYFIKYEELYGANALMMYGLAANESGWGLSSISQNSNNLFGHAAYDSDAEASAERYDSVENSIKSHAQYFISEGYLDPKDGYGRFYGGHFGDKSSGMNVKYASDPYWGEKAAEYCWAVYEYFQNNSSYEDNNDAFKYTLAIQNGALTLNVRKEATTSSTALYQTKAVSNFPFIVMEEVYGQSVSGNNKWYKIQSDAPLKSDRSDIVQDNGLYDFEKDYAYISTNYATIINEGTASVQFDPEAYLTSAGLSLKNGYVYISKAKTTMADLKKQLNAVDASINVTINTNGNTNNENYVSTNMILELTDTSKNTYKYTIAIKADVNKDGKINSVDYLMIKDTIMSKYTMSDVQKIAADVNGDGKVNAPDYLMIKDYIMGKITL